MYILIIINCRCFLGSDELRVFENKRNKTSCRGGIISVAVAKFTTLLQPHSSSLFNFLLAQRFVFAS